MFDRYVPRRSSLRGHYRATSRVGCRTTEETSLPPESTMKRAKVFPVDTVILHRIAFAVWHTALHLQSEQMVTKAAIHPSGSTVGGEKALEGRQQHPQREEEEVEAEEGPEGEVVGKGGKVVSMELAYVTEHIIALWLPAVECDARVAKETNEDAQEQMLAEAGSMLRVKHADNCMVFDLSIPKEADLHNETCCLGMSSHYLGWQGSTLAPPLERLCSACKYIESWLSTNPQHIAVLFSRGPSSKERIGVVISAYLTYSGICGSEEQALDRFAMGRFFKDKIGRLTSPSNVRYVSHFSGLLSGGIRMNAEPLFLTSITIHGAPAFNANSKGNSTCPWRSNGFGTDILVLSQDDMDRCGKQQTFHFFLKIYQQGLTLVYSSPVYELSASSEQLTIGLENMQTYPTDSPLHLRGDVLIKGYYLCRNQLCEGCHCNSSGHTLHRHALFQCQFHTCAVAKRSLCFSKAELDEVDGNEGNFKYPPDNGVLELHFSGLRESWACAASSIPLASEASPEGGCCAQPPLSSALYLPYADEEEEQFLAGSIVAHNSMEELCTTRKKKGGEESTAEAIADWANGVLDKEREGTNCGPRSRLEEVGHLSGPLDGSLYATVSKGHPANERTERWRQMDLSCGEGSAVRSVGVDARSAASSPPRAACAPTPTSPLRSTVAASDTRRREALHSPPLHARLDELLGDMLMTVENIPDLRPPPCEGQPGGGDAEEDIPYHARRDGRPFTYGAVPERKTERLRKEEDDDDMHSELSSPGLVRRASRAGGRAERKGEGRLPIGDDEDADGYSSIDTYTSLTWLQQQQQKLRDRREGKTRLERCPQEFRLLRELRTYQRCSSASGTQTLPAGGRWQGREDGYASDTSLPVGLDMPDHNGSAEGEDDWDGRVHAWRGGREQVEWSRGQGRGESRKVGENLTLPLRINTGMAGAVMENMLSEPGSPLLPRRSVSRETASRYTKGTAHVMAKSREESTLRTIGSGVTMQSLYGRSEPQMEGERPFVAVKRAHELAATRHKSKESTGSFDDGMTTSVSQSRDDSFSSWATVSMPWGEEEEEEVDEETEEEDGDSRRGKARPQTPAFPVHPRTPYSNGSTTHVGYVDHQQNSTFVDDHGIASLPPKSPTTTRKDRLQMSVSPELQQQIAANQRPLMANGGSAVQKQALSTEIVADIVSTPSSGGLKQLFGDHQEVSPAHVKFVRDTSRFWYKPTISREEAIAILRDKQPGTFIVRDSNSFPGAFGLALKVATPPTNVPSRIPSSTNSNLDMQNELVRHFLIEPTSRGVKLKGCVNEPVFSSLSALVYQHSLTAMALPCRLILPESEPAALRTVASTDGSVNSNQILLQQGAACNVLYLISVDTESLTGPQAVRRAVADLFSKQPMPAPTVVHFKVSGQGITLTDNKRKLFFRRHYPVNSISHCGLDPDDHRWTEKNEDLGNSICSNRCFGFVARKPSSKGDNQCHIFAELDPEQPASAIVNFVTRVMMAGTVGKTSNIV